MNIFGLIAVSLALNAADMSNLESAAPDSSSASTNQVADAMPVLARHAGTWRGVYRRYDHEGRLVESFPSEVITRFPAGQDYDYHQTNIYRPEDAPERVIESYGVIKDGRLVFENAVIRGYAVDDLTDPNARTTLLHLAYQDGSGRYMYEIIQISDDGERRHRAAQYFNSDGSLLRRTLIDEIRDRR